MTGLRVGRTSIYAPLRASGLLLSTSILIGTSVAPVNAADTISGSASSSGLLSQSIPNTRNFQAPLISPSTTILPTDVVPLPQVENRLTFAENLQLRILQRLPARFYFSGSCEASFRLETNPFQFPNKRTLLRQLPPPAIIRQLAPSQQQQILNILKLSSSYDNVFRVLPNVTGGFTITPKTRVFANYFMIRDQLFKNARLNTVIHSYAGGIQRDFPLGSRGNLQAEFQFRELNQIHQQAVFDFLPGLTASYVLTPRTVLFANALLQMRGKKYFQAPTKEIDPFYTWGGLYQRNGWSFSASSTFVQNFREPFKGNATIPLNNYAFICDFEIARRLFRQVPGMQAFVRAEPIFNFHSHNRPGLAGTDFRLFYGLRIAAAKPSLTAGLEQLRQQIEEQEIEAPSPDGKSKPSAFLMPYEITASAMQPIHGPKNIDAPVIAQDTDSDKVPVITASDIADAIQAENEVVPAGLQPINVGESIAQPASDMPAIQTDMKSIAEMKPVVFMRM